MRGSFLISSNCSEFDHNIFANNASPLAWTRLKTQDPYGKLHEVIFLYLMKKWL